MLKFSIKDLIMKVLKCKDNHKCILKRQKLNKLSIKCITYVSV